MLIKMWCLTIILLCITLAVGEIDCCGQCNRDKCPHTADKCPAGFVTDPCRCCPRGVCGLPEGEKCTNNTDYVQCGYGLVCLPRPDLQPMDIPESLCVCTETQMVCGSNNKTYTTVCEMRQDAALEHIYLRHWGPCRSAPEITSASNEMVFTSLHSGLTLDCEVKGYPIPTIQWEFTGHDGSSRFLPSDDLLVAVQARGGPEPYMSTSWVQIINLRESDAGIYTCVASNVEGSARHSTRVALRH